MCGYLAAALVTWLKPPPIPPVHGFALHVYNKVKKKDLSYVCYDFFSFRLDTANHCYDTSVKSASDLKNEVPEEDAITMWETNEKGPKQAI